ncbi:ABC transporter permease [Bifidobacterium moraviense]|nr:ABC transporter permease [Bifidobacterium sp. DSM 109958]
MTNRRMFVAMLFGAVFRRRGRAIMAVVASMVGAATLFCLAAVCLVVPQQMNDEMRAYGANLIVTPLDSSAGSQGLTDDEVAAVSADVDRSGQAKSAAYRYENVRINSAPYVIGGIDPAQVAELNQHWVVDGDWPSVGNVMIGRDVADAMGLEIGSTITIAYRASDNGAASSDASASASASSSASSSSTAAPTANPTQAAASAANGQQVRDGRVSTDIMEGGGTEFRVAGLVDTGGSEDEIVYALASDVAALAGNRGWDVVEYSSPAEGDGLTALTDELNRAGKVKAQQVTKITASNQRIVAMLQTLFWIVSLVVLLLTLVGVSTTISSIVSQRRNEIGLRKALGASSRGIGAEFYAESAIYGLVGGLIGTAIGYGFAAALTVTVFSRSLGFNWWLGLGSVALSVLVAVVASVPPVHRATRIDPAVVLREE